MTKQMNQSPTPAQPRVVALLACGQNMMLDAAEFIYECRLIEQNCWGDHSIFVCDVARIRLHENPTGRLALFCGKGRYMSTGEVYQAQKALP